MAVCEVLQALCQHKLVPNIENVVFTYITMLTFDTEEVATLARSVAASFKAPSFKDLHQQLYPLLGDDRNTTRVLAAKALEFSLSKQSDASVVEETTKTLLSKFHDEGVSMKLGVGFAMEQIIPHLVTWELQEALLKFIFEEGLPIAEKAVSEQFFKVGLALVEAHGKENVQEFVSKVEEFVGKEDEKVSLGVSVILGTLCKHLAAEDPKLGALRAKLILKITEAEQESVQQKLCQALPSLLKVLATQDNEAFERIANTLLEASFNEKAGNKRRGAAYGFAACIKAKGLGALRHFKVTDKLKKTVEDKDSSGGSRQGALRVYQALSFALGRLYEPYVAGTLPVLLEALADGSSGVREAANEAAGQIMANLSAHGVKPVLPSLLEKAADGAWRTKLGSVSLLATMANCAPKQLAACLPKIVPVLCGTVADVHNKVCEETRKAFSRFGELITNPEIKQMLPDILASLCNPGNEKLNKRALDVLLETSFMHSVDTASLAHLFPLVLRASKGKSWKLKEKGAKIVGSMALLVSNPKDAFQPYLDELLPQLKASLVDSIPDVRVTAAKALGSISNVLPDTILKEIMPWLLKMLKSGEGQVERSGAANGLSEVLVAFGDEAAEKVLPAILTQAEDLNAKAAVREGSIGLFVYLPSVMKVNFEKWIPKVFPVVLSRLGDSQQSVREVAHRAAMSICVAFGSSSSALLFSPLEDAMFAEKWQVRHSSVQLFGTLVENMPRNIRRLQNRDNLIECEVMTKERRAFLLSSLHIVRSDPNRLVKQQANTVWKSVVRNTPRTLRELLPILTKRLISNLASDSLPRQESASRCIGDLVTRLGDRVLSELMPILVSSLDNFDNNMRAGVCLGLCEIIQAAEGNSVLSKYMPSMLPAIRAVICDEDELVGSRASKCISLLYSSIGKEALTSVVSELLSRLSQGDPNAVRGLRSLFCLEPHVIFPLVLNFLTESPVTEEKLSGMAMFSGAENFVARALPKMITMFVECEKESLDYREVATSLLPSLSPGILFSEVVKLLGDAEPERRSCGLRLFVVFLQSRSEEDTVDFSGFCRPIVSLVLPISARDSCKENQELGFDAFSKIVSFVGKEKMVEHLSVIREVLLKEAGKAETLPGFACKNAVESLFTVYQQALFFGSKGDREMAANAVGDLLRFCPAEGIKPGLPVKLAGPLIRVLGDRFQASVKCAILASLKLLLEKFPFPLRPFFAQLQSAYVKCVSDSCTEVQNAAFESLELLANHSARTAAVLADLTKERGQ